jgi:hypothetical protein
MWLGAWFLGAALSQGIVFEPALGRAPEGTWIARAGSVVACVRQGGLGIALLGDARHGAALSLDFGGEWPRLEGETCRTLTRLRGRERWSGESVFARARWSSVAPGVDLVLREGGGGLEYDLEIAYGARPELFEAQVRGHEALWIGPEGELVIETAAGALVQSAPLAWSLDSGRSLPCRFELRGGDRFGFALPFAGECARIDPMLRFSTYLTGEYEQEVRAVAIGSQGATIAAGTTFSLDFPTTLGAFDPFYSGGTEGFVSCLSADGTTLVWSTLIGGSGDETVRSVCVTPTGAVLVGGTSASADFPTTLGVLKPTLSGSQDAFVAKLASDGSQLEWSTYFGGSGVDRFGELQLAANGEVVLCGTTRGGLPAGGGAFDTSYNGGPFFGDAFVARLSADGTQTKWCGYLGGSGDELAERLSLDASGAPVVTGTTYSALFPTTTGAFDRAFAAPSDAWVARFDASGAQLLFSTLLGGSGEESVLDLEVEASGTVLCVGEVRSDDFPLVQPLDSGFEGESEGFFTRLSADGTMLVRSSFFGGTEADRVSAVGTDSVGRVVLGGDSWSEDLPTTVGAWSPAPNQSAAGAAREAFLARLPATLDQWEYATYFGSRQGDTLESLALDSRDEVTFGGVTYGPGLPVSAGAFQPDWNVLALSQGYVSRLALLLTPIPFGKATLNSLGGRAQIRWQGFASASEGGFRVGVDVAAPLAWSQVMRSTQRQNLPFLGGRMYLAPPLKRYLRVKTDFLGYAMRDIPIEPWLAGQTLYFQVWYEDPGSPQGGALSDALSVLVHL